MSEKTMIPEGAPAFDLSGGELCLDFSNTVSWRPDGQPLNDSLTSYPLLVSWGWQAGTLTDGQARELLEEAERRPAEAEDVLEKARALRETIYRAFSAVAAGIQPDERDLALLNESLSDALARLKVVPDGEGFVWGWSEEEAALDRMLWPVARSAGELLTSERLDRTRECSGETCGWLFMDMSRNRSRRWCDMNDCGNRAKARRHYARKRDAAGQHESHSHGPRTDAAH